MSRRLLACAALLLGPATGTLAQTFSQRGFAEGAALAYPQEAPNDATQVVADLLVRAEAFFKPAAWIQFGAGLDIRANTHDQVDERWAPDFWDRDLRRPPLSVRRLAASLRRGAFTIDVGKQFVRWGKTDIVSPTDRFAPRDFMNVVESELLGVTAARGAAQVGAHAFEAVWVPRFTPSRSPLVDQRWAGIPPAAANVPLTQAPPAPPAGSQVGLRYAHVGDRVEYSLSFFDGFNHMPDIRSTARTAPGAAGPPTEIEIVQVYPPIRTYGGDLAWPLRWFTVKAEAAYLTSSSPSTDEYALYVLEIERLSGEWAFAGGYVGEAVTRRRAVRTFAPDRGMSRSFVARVSHTIDANRGFAVEAAVRQDGRGAYGKAEYSQARGQHWRATLTLAALGGQPDDFFGQYRRNSHLTVRVRYSF